MGSFWVAIRRYRREVPQKQISYRTKTAADNQKVTIYAWNSGNSVIDPEDYISPIGFNFGKNVQIRESIVVEQSPEDLGIEAKVLDARKLELAPLVLNPKDSFTLHVRMGETELTVNPRPYGRVRGVHQLFRLIEAERETGKPAGPSGLTYAAFGSAGFLLLLALVLITIQVLYDVLIAGAMSEDELLQTSRLGWHLNWTDILFIGATLVAGSWLRIKHRQKPLKSYIAFGLFVGVVITSVMMLLEYTVLHPPYMTVQDEIARGVLILEDIVKLVRVFVINIAVTTILLISGGMFGGLIDARRSNRSITQDAKISKKLVETMISPDSPLFEKVVKVLAVLYPPALLFCGTVLNGLFA